MFKFDFNLEDTDCDPLDSRIGTEVNEEQTPLEKKPPPLVKYQIQDLASNLYLRIFSYANPHYYR